MAERVLMALFDEGHRLELRNGYYMQKQDDNQWQIGGPCGDIVCLLSMHIASNVPVGPRGSMDSEIQQFAAAMAGVTQ